MATKEPAARALALFDRYAEMPHAALSEALARLQAEEPGVCTELMRMLAADEQTHTFPSPLRWFVAPERSGDARADADGGDGRDALWSDGTRIGPWRVQGIVGLGGMGVVYAAQRADGLYEREVALKTIRAELMSPAMQEAFAKERRHLAKLDHPSIVALYDAGIADDGQPWLAMPRVHGEPIDRWCDAHRADLRVRVRMLTKACDAIAYAHAHGVLHQDIKPSNLLVTDDGKVKLLDFGLSALRGPQGEAGFVRIGVSSAYAAPEVFGGAPPSVAIDVYALGVVLYRMLCDGWPRKSRSLAAMPPDADDMPRSPSRLAQDAPRDASAAIARARGMCDAQALARALRPDLDAIALRCVRRDPVERYASVADLCADLRAWLERRPVAAHRGGWAYRAVRYVRRNALPVAALTMLAFGAVVGGGMALQQRQRAQLEADNTEILSQLFEKSLGAATLSSLGSAPLSSKALLEDAERQLRTTAGGARPRFLSRGLSTLARAWLVRADHAKAEALLKESKTLGAGDPLQVARTDAALAQLFNLRSNSGDAERLVSEGLDLLSGMEGHEAEIVGLDLRMQRSLALWGRGDVEAAIKVLDAAVIDAEAMGDAGRPALGELLGQRGYVMTQLFRFKQAEVDLQRALVVLDVRDPAASNTVRRHLANLLVLLNRRQEALRHAQALLEENRRLFGDAHPETGRAWILLGKIWFYQSDEGKALAANGVAREIFSRSVGLSHPDFVDVLVTRGAIEYSHGLVNRSVATAREAVDILERAYGPNHEKTLKRKADFASMLLHGGDAAGGRQKGIMFSEAESLLSRIIATGERQGLPVGYARDEYADVLLHFHRVDEADREAQRGIDEMSAIFGADSDYPVAAWISMMRVRIAQKRHDEASEIGLRIIGRMEAPEQSPYEHFMMRKLLWENEVSRGDPQRIRRTYRDAETLARRYEFMSMLGSNRAR